MVPGPGGWTGPLGTMRRWFLRGGGGEDTPRLPPRKSTWIFEAEGSPADASGAFRSSPRAPTKAVNPFFQNSKPILQICESSLGILGRLDLSPCCPGKKAGAEVKKGREKSSRSYYPCLRKETRWLRHRCAETAEARIGKRGITAFFGEANAFLPGHGILYP